MRKLPVCIVVMILSVFQPIMIFAQYEGDIERRLPIVLEGFEDDPMSMDVWDMSQQWMATDRSASCVKLYGDTLLAETVSGRRSWYELRGDSIFFSSEEDRMSVIRCDSLTFVCFRQSKPNYTLNTDFKAHGTTGGRKFAVVERGLLSYCTSERPRRLILASGDTIRNAMLTRETRSFTTDFASDSTKGAPAYTIITFRWYDINSEDALLPVAIQRTVFSGDMLEKGGRQKLQSTIYVRDRLDLPQKNKKDNLENIGSDTELLREALTRFTADINGRELTVRLGLPMSGVQINLDIMDAAGRLYIHEQYVSDGGEQTFTMDCTELRSGEYIVAVNVDAVEAMTEKRYIKIR